ncbi:MAG: hypothetical protein ACFFFC_07910 [Candidatus Thorarchaeota archaeon]
MNSFKLSPMRPYVAKVTTSGQFFYYGFYHSCGGRTNPFPYGRLQDHCNKDRLIVRGDRDWGDTLDDWYNGACHLVHLVLSMTNLGRNRQILVILEIETERDPTVQVFVGYDLVREEDIFEQDNIALLLDMTNPVKIYVRPKNQDGILAFYKASVFVI